MSLPFTDVRCDKCAKHWGSYLLWGGFNYRAGHSRTIRIERDLGWCRSCAEFRAVEVLPSRLRLEAELEAQQNELRDAERKASARVFSKLFRSVAARDERIIAANRARVDAAAAGLEWRDARRSAPKCLECGSSDIDHVGAIGSAPEPHQIALKHPGCGGNLVVTTPEVRINIRTEDRLYDAEGRLLEVNEEPTRSSGNRSLDS